MIEEDKDYSYEQILVFKLKYGAKLTVCDKIYMVYLILTSHWLSALIVVVTIGTLMWVLK